MSALVGTQAAVVAPENSSPQDTGKFSPMSSRGPRLIVVMQPTDLWDFHDRPKLRPLARPRHRTIHLQRPVCAPVMIIGEVFGQEPPQMALV
jgi:hypothetical protein